MQRNNMTDILMSELAYLPDESGELAPARALLSSNIRTFESKRINETYFPMYNLVNYWSNNLSTKDSQRKCVKSHS